MVFESPISKNLFQNTARAQVKLQRLQVQLESDSKSKLQKRLKIRFPRPSLTRGRAHAQVWS